MSIAARHAPRSRPPGRSRAPGRCWVASSPMRNIAVVSARPSTSPCSWLYPIFSAFAGSLHDWNPLIDKYDWVGFDNFVNVLTDGLFWKSLWNTAIYSFFSILFRVVLGLALALLLSSKARQVQGHAARPVLHADDHPAGGRLLRVDVDVRSAVRHDRQDHRTRHQLAQRFALRHAGGHHHDHLEGFRLRHRAVSRRHHGAAARRVRGGADRRRQLVADLPVDHAAAAQAHHAAHRHHLADLLPAGVCADPRDDQGWPRHRHLHHQAT